MEEEQKARVEKLQAETALLKTNAKCVEDEHASNLEKIRSETALIKLQSNRATREENDATANARRWSSRYLLIPTPTHFIQAVVGGLVFLAVVFVFYKPYLEVVEKEEQTKNVLAKLDAQIQENENIKLKQENEEEQRVLNLEKKKLEEQAHLHESRIEKLAADSRSLRFERQKLTVETASLRDDQRKLKQKYSSLAKKAKQGSKQKVQYEAQIKEADLQIKSIYKKVESLKSLALKEAKKRQLTIETNALAGLNVFIFVYGIDLKSLKPLNKLSSELSNAGATVVTNKNALSAVGGEHGKFLATTAQWNRLFENTGFSLGSPSLNTLILSSKISSKVTSQLLTLMQSTTAIDRLSYVDIPRYDAVIVIFDR